MKPPILLMVALAGSNLLGTVRAITRAANSQESAPAEIQFVVSNLQSAIGDTPDCGEPQKLTAVLTELRVPDPGKWFVATRSR
jgi:hypothetical protein